MNRLPPRQAPDRRVVLWLSTNALANHDHGGINWLACEVNGRVSSVHLLGLARCGRPLRGAGADDNNDGEVVPKMWSQSVKMNRSAGVGRGGV